MLTSVDFTSFMTLVAVAELMTHTQKCEVTFKYNTELFNVKWNMSLCNSTLVQHCNAKILLDIY